MIKQTELITIRDFIRYATSRFNAAKVHYGHGTDNGWDEAIALILPALSLPHSIHSTVLDARLVAKERAQLLELIECRITTRLPAPYLTQEAWFAHMPFYVDQRVLIPRSSIAELIENQFQPWIDVESIQHILDLCTGSACIAIACAKTFPHALVDASDLSRAALAVAEMNVSRHAVNHQVTLYEANLFAGLPQKKYDLIVSNPPYVSLKEMDTLPPEYLHEPREGLIAGKEGLDFAIPILQHASHHLQPHGILILEVGNSEQALINAFPQVPFTWLAFERSEGGVCLLTAAQLRTYQSAFETDGWQHPR
jgi:ribosomal protein L3 glutamine methyltransferase